MSSFSLASTFPVSFRSKKRPQNAVSVSLPKQKKEYVQKWNTLTTNANQTHSKWLQLKKDLDQLKKTIRKPNLSNQQFMTAYNKSLVINEKRQKLRQKLKQLNNKQKELLQQMPT